MASKIENGPSKYELMLALFDRKGDHLRPVTFMTSPSVGLVLHITSVGIEDGSGDSWIVEGISGTGRFKGHYRTDTRKGSIERIERIET